MKFSRKPEKFGRQFEMCRVFYILHKRKRTAAAGVNILPSKVALLGGNFCSLEEIFPSQRLRKISKNPPLKFFG